VVYVNQTEALVCSEDVVWLSLPTFMRTQWLEDWKKIEGDTLESERNISRKM
jgi:hypothetical protein